MEGLRLSGPEVELSTCGQVVLGCSFAQEWLLQVYKFGGGGNNNWQSGKSNLIFQKESRRRRWDVLLLHWIRNEQREFNISIHTSSWPPQNLLSDWKAAGLTTCATYWSIRQLGINKHTHKIQTNHRIGSHAEGIQDTGPRLLTVDQTDLEIRWAVLFSRMGRPHQNRVNLWHDQSAFWKPFCHFEGNSIQTLNASFTTHCH